MKKLSPQEQRTLKLGLGFMLIFCVIWYGIMPAWKAYKQLDMDLQAAQIDYTKASQSLGTTAGFKKHYETYTEAYDELKSRYFSGMSENEGMLKFLALVEELTESTGITILSKTTGINEEKGFRVLKVNLTLKGTPDQLTDLLLAYKSSEIVIRVDRLRIDRDETEDVLQLKITVSTLIIQEEGVADAKPKS